MEITAAARRMRDMKSSYEFKIIARYEHRNRVSSLFQVLAALVVDRESAKVAERAMNALCRLSLTESIWKQIEETKLKIVMMTTRRHQIAFI